jgi:hypothetical protein
MGARDHLARIHRLPCILCDYLGLGDSPSEAHHLESVRDADSSYSVCPLCAEHHRGATGIHGLHRRAFYARYHLSEIDLMGLTIQMLDKCGALR